MDVVEEFKCFMEENKDFTKESQDKDGVLWKKLRSMKTGEQLPEDAFQ